MLLLRGSDIERALPMCDAIHLMGQAFTAITSQAVQSTHRQVLKTGAGHALLMGAVAPGLGLTAKLISVLPGNREKGLPVSTGLALLVDESDGHPLALLDATSLTAWRTAAAAGFATDLLARQDARVALLVGCGTQARTQLIAMFSIRDLEEIRIVARNTRRLHEFIANMQKETTTPLIAAEDLRLAAQDADIITTATSSSEPVIDADAVPPGCHINGIGSFRPEMCEVDPGLMELASVFVESRRTAAAEAGELVAACRCGFTTESAWVEMGEVLRGQHPGRISSTQITFYKSVGHAAFDLFAARAVVRQASASRMGEEWNL